MDLIHRFRDAVNANAYQIERFLKKHGTITNADVREMLDVSSATANRILAKMTDEGKIQKIRISKSWGYELL